MKSQSKTHSNMLINQQTVNLLLVGLGIGSGLISGAPAATLAALALAFSLAFSLALAVTGAAGRADSHLLGVSGGHDVGGEAEDLTEVLETIFSASILSRGADDEVVMPLPVKDFLEVALGLQGVADHVDLVVPHVELVMLVLADVLLDDHDTLFEEVGEDLPLFFSGDHNHGE